MSQAEEEEGVNRATQEFVSIQMSNFSADLLQKLVSRTHFSEKLKEEEEADEEEIELSLGLSLNGRFGVDPARAKNGNKFSLKRSSSIPDFATSQGESECHVTTAARCHVGLARTCSLPTETEEEWRKRKELQSLRRMEAKRKRSEKQRNSISKAVRTSGRADLESNNNGGDKDNGLPPQAASFQGSTGSHGSGSSGVSESDCRASQGYARVPKCPEIRSPTGVQSLQESEQKLTVTHRSSITRLTSGDFNALATESQSNKSTFTKNGTKEVARNVLEDMPCVSTTGLGPNGKRIEGFLYRYRKGEEVRIVCVCHGSFLSPAEFVKHAGGGDVAHPLKHIVVNPASFF